MAECDFEAYNNTILAHGGLPFTAENCRSITHKNNIYIRESSGIVYAIYNSERTNSATTLTSNYNFIYPEPSTTSGTDVVEISAAIYPARDFMTWSEATGAGHEANGIGYSSGWTNPNLTAALKLNSGSLAVDAGQSQSGTFTVDADGTTRPQGAAWDMGAFELVQSVGTTASARVGAGTQQGPIGLR